METMVNRLFGLMDSWRHLPAYRLEPRADIFFALYLPALVTEKLGLDVRAVLPEFPLRKGTLNQQIRDCEANRSFKVDYLCQLALADRVLLIELKTDDASRRCAQDDYLEAAKRVGFRELLRGVCVLRDKTDARSRGKYDTLLHEFQRMGYLANVRRRWEVTDSVPDRITVLYIQPRAVSNECMGFAEVAAVVERHEDALSSRFAKSLRQWASVPPGFTQRPD